MANSRKEFLTQELPKLLKGLKADAEPSFGLMTAQHMVEHITAVIKLTVKRYGEPPAEPTQRQLGFQKFLANGAVMKHRPSDKTKADLPPLKYATLEEALEQYTVGSERFYNHFEANPDFKAYHDFMGELGLADLELFHYQHFRYHAWQFGLIDSFGPAEV